MRKGMALGVMISFASLLGALVAMAAVFTQSLSPDASAVLSGISVLCLISLMIGLLIAVAYSEDGFAVSGSTLEWMVAAALSPGIALLLYFFARGDSESCRPDYIDVTDEKRMSRL